MSDTDKEKTLAASMEQALKLSMLDIIIDFFFYAFSISQKILPAFETGFVTIYIYSKYLSPSIY